MTEDIGLMRPVLERTETGEMMSALRKAFGPSRGETLTLEEELERLTEERLKLVLNIAQYVKMASGWDETTPYHVLVERMYGRMDMTTKRLVAAILQDADPREEPDTPAPDKRLAAQKAVYEQMAFDFDTAAQAEVQAFKDAQAEAETPETTMDSFMRKMAMSESSGDPNAEITLEDGRTFTGLWQFGDARLSDYRKATGAKFTTAEFKEDEQLQQKVAEWHFADIQDAIDDLGDEADSYDRDGLMAVAHLSGIGGMRKFVRSGGTYNPSDSLGTSAQDYYNKFAS
jgi:hypothetical protein